LAHAYDWPQVRWCGVLKRKRCRGRQATWTEAAVIWIAGGELTTSSAEQALAWLRGHWEIENRLFLCGTSVRMRTTSMAVLLCWR